MTSVPFDDLTRVLKEDLNAETKDLFLEVDQSPVGCASLAQVHRGVLKNGEEVAIKIQYPTVAKKTQVDLWNMEIASRICERIFPKFQFSVGFICFFLSFFISLSVYSSLTLILIHSNPHSLYHSITLSLYSL